MKQRTSFSHRSLFCNFFKLRRIIKNQEVMIIGSSPFSDFRRYKEGMIIVNLNGSVARNKSYGLPSPVITFLDFEIVDQATQIEKKNRKEIIQNSLLLGVNLGYVILTQSNSSRGGDLQEITNDFKQVIKISKKLRRWIVLFASRNLLLEKKRDGLLSTGGFALSFISLLSPKLIYLSGFSLYKDLESDDPPHFYDVGEKLDASKLEGTRSHSLADSLLISILALRGLIIITDDRDIKPLISNWGFR